MGCDLPVEALDFRFFAADAVRFIPVDFRAVDAAIDEPNPSNPFLLPPVTLAIRLLQTTPLANASPGRDCLYVHDSPDNFEHPCGIGQLPSWLRDLALRMQKSALLWRLIEAMLGHWCRGLSACAVLSATLLGSRVLRAQDLGPTLLSYRAPDGCPSVADFQRSVQRRSARVRFVDEGAHDRALSITLRKDGDQTNGELRLIERDGNVRQRDARFATCAEALEGLALIAVVSLDPQALLEPDRPAEPPALPVPVPLAVPAAAAKPPPAQAKAAPARESLPATQPAKLQLAIGGALNLAIRALPEPALGGSLFLDLASGSRARFAPLLRVALSHVERRGLDSESGAEASFTLTLATVSACPWRFAAGFFALRPCGFASGGVLFAKGSKTNDLQQRTRPYGALGGSLSLFARASQTIDIVADLAAGATLVRDSFGFEQDPPWQTPALYLSSAIGARFVFP